MSSSDATTPNNNPRNKLKPGSNPVKQISNGTLAADGDGYTQVLAFLRDVVARCEHCPSLSIRSATAVTVTSCTCLHRLRPTADDDSTAELLQRVARYVCYFGALPNEQRRLLEIAWIQSALLIQSSSTCTARGANNKVLAFHLQQLPSENGTVPAGHEQPAAAAVGEIPVCVNAFRLVYGLGEDRYRRSKKHAMENTVPVHALTGRTGNRKNKDILAAEQSLEAFFSVIAQEAGHELGGSQEGCVVELPHHSKRALHRRWCWESGHVVKTDAKGIDTITARPNDDDDWPVGSQVKAILSLKTFCSYWEKHHKNLKVRAKSKDTSCGE